MFDSLKKRAFADPYSAPSLICRLLLEDGIRHWRAYAFVLTMMSVMAACIATSAYLIGYAVNAAWVSRNIAAVLSVCAGIIIAGYARFFNLQFTRAGIASGIIRAIERQS